MSCRGGRGPPRLARTRPDVVALLPELKRVASVRCDPGSTGPKTKWGVTLPLDNAHIGSEPGEETTTLPEIPVLDVGIDWPFETLEREFNRINAMLDEGSRR